MATFIFDKTGDAISINDYDNANPGHFTLFLDNDHEVLIVHEDATGRRWRIYALSDTIIVNYNSFSGSASELKDLLASDVFTVPPAEGSNKPYLSYVAILAQLNTDVPSAIIIENALPFEPVWQRIQAGYYFINNKLDWDREKTLILLNSGYPAAVTAYVDGGYMYFSSFEPGSTTVLADSQIWNTGIEIRIYP